MIKSNTSISVYEYDPIKDHELVDSLKQLFRVDRDHSKYIKLHNGVLSFKHFVGTLQTRTYTLSVLPKIWQRDNRTKTEIRKNLIRLLLYTYIDTSLFRPDMESGSDYENQDLFELLIMFYARTLDQQLEEGIFRKYVRINEESSYLRGRLNLKKQINKLDKSKFDITDFRFSADNELNRFFARCTNLLSALAKDPRNLNLLAPIQLLLRSENVPDSSLPTRVDFNRLNERFRIPYAYGDLILNHLRIESGMGDRTMMMLFDMNIVFQEFVVKFFNRNKAKIFPGIEVKLLSQHSNRNFIFEGTKALRSTKPDLKIVFPAGDGDRTITVDMKYKILEEPKIEEDTDDSEDNVFSIGPSDLYQMFTYSELYESDDNIFIFPGPENKCLGPYQFKRNGRRLWIYMLNIDLNKDEWEMEQAEHFKKFFEKLKEHNRSDEVVITI
ncbi:MAG: hypothetical protein QW292_10960 [Candidatus Parvarchaeota archaeon]